MDSDVKNDAELKEEKLNQEQTTVEPETVEASDKQNEEKQENNSFQKEMEAKQEEINQLKDQLLRKAADFDNFRKRMQREKKDAIKYANQTLLLDIIAIIDNFERAISSGKETKDFSTFFDGVEMIRQELVSMLEKKHGLKGFESKDQEFDPEKHEAIAMEAADTEEQVILEEFQKGYTYGDRVLRHAKVKVSQPTK